MANQSVAQASSPSTAAVTQWADLLRRAVTEPGMIAQAYSAFHGFSLGNQLLAAVQCAERSLPLGPLATFPGWKAKGRHVKRGEKALWLWLPITGKRTVTGNDGREEEVPYKRFVLKPHWFTLAQTEGVTVEPTPTPGWDRGRALVALDVTEVPFAMMDGNVLGYAKGRTIAVSPVNPMPHKTTFHELAHVLLGHTGEGIEAHEGENLPRNLREVEAEAVTLLCVESLGMDGAAYCRGYLQHWLSGQVIPEASAQRVFKIADQILRAGRADKAGAA